MKWMQEADRSGMAEVSVRSCDMLAFRIDISSTYTYSDVDVAYVSNDIVM